MSQILNMMTVENARVLERDLVEWGSVVAGMSRDQIRNLLPATRADRLYIWLRSYGSANPVQWWGKKNLDVHDEREVGTNTHLIIPDCHAAPGQDLRRFTWLGRMIADLQPTKVVSLGDWYSLDSLCQHRTLAERSQDRTVEEIKAGEMALAALEAEIAGKWDGQKHIVLGNHDDRLRQLTNDAPWLEGMFNVGAAHEARGWQVYDYLKPFRLDGIWYQHYLSARGGFRAISGKFHALRLLERTMFAESVVVGHSHQFKHWTEANLQGKRVHGLVAGCYLEHIEDYAGEDNHTWWRGITVLRNVKDGDYDLETWTMDRIRETYGAGGLELAAELGELDRGLADEVE